MRRRLKTLVELVNEFKDSIKFIKEIDGSVYITVESDLWHGDTFYLHSMHFMKMGRSIDVRLYGQFWIDVFTVKKGL